MGKRKFLTFEQSEKLPGKLGATDNLHAVASTYYENMRREYLAQNDDEKAAKKIDKQKKNSARLARSAVCCILAT